MRLAQVAPVWAVGVSRKRIGRLELWRSLALAAFTFVAALPVGLVLGWVLLDRVNAEAFGWRLPMHFFPDDWLQLAALAGAAAFAAALWPAYRLARLTPARMTQVFSQER